MTSHEDHGRMTGHGEHGAAGFRFAAVPGNVEGYGGRGVDGAAYRPPGGYYFLDKAGAPWWVIFQEFPEAGPRGPQVHGDVLGCCESHEDLVHVRVLAPNVNRADADAAFRKNPPSTYEEAVEVASRIPRAESRG